ncbi:MAG TPA: DUF362 domain-containing protein [bacterium]|nr:DUF362 domain-containing protein [bacterium]HQG45558.1 DUF362 domain-containing protein [bacterium]HQI48113.1 DUF362 domain-containing protein [bacterium]HQJ64509.1 DUF362 domain-containing protein [bacterium]
MQDKITRRDFIRIGAGAGLAVTTLPGAPQWLQAAPASPLLAVARNGAPGVLVRKAVEALGGMGQFVKKGQSVLLKPNMGWDRLPEQAANTNPEAVAEVIKMCFEAGAAQVRVLDRTCNEPRRCYLRSGIEKAAKAAGAEVRHIVESRFEEIQIPGGELVTSWPIYRDAIESDVIINMPIAKHHSISGVTLSFKNLMGLLGGDRGALHNHFMTKIVDINTAVKPALTIIDAWRIMLRNGPTGGSLADVAEKRIILASADRVAADAWAMGLFNIDPATVEYLRHASRRGLGQLDLKRVKIEEINLGV